MSKTKICPRWVEEYRFISQLLHGLLDKADKGKRPTFTVKQSKGNQLFAPLFEFSGRQADDLWRLVLILEHEYSVIKLVPPKQPPEPWEPLYQGTSIRLNPQQESLLRQWLKRPAFDPYHLTWQEALNKHRQSFPLGVQSLYEKPVRVPGHSAAEVVAAFAAVGDYLHQCQHQCKHQTQHHENPGAPLSLRELSATCFWGNSKYLENHRELTARLFPDLSSFVLTRPLLVEVRVPQLSDEAAANVSVVFIENQDTFIKACRDGYSRLRHCILVYCAGFRLSNQKGRGEGEAIFAYVASPDQSAMTRFESWWFGQGVQADYEGRCFFWGDLDFSGMAILKSLRDQFPQLTAWQTAYQLMADAVVAGIGHSPAEADKTEQKDPGGTGCCYADESLLPLLRQHQRFIDQEWCSEF